MQLPFTWGCSDSSVEYKDSQSHINNKSWAEVSVFLKDSDYSCSDQERDLNKPTWTKSPVITNFLLSFILETESENEFRPLDERIDEFHPKATRTLFIGNLEKTTTYHDLRNIFQRFGGIVVCESCPVWGSAAPLSVQTCEMLWVVLYLSRTDHSDFLS